MGPRLVRGMCARRRSLAKATGSRGFVAYKYIRRHASDAETMPVTRFQRSPQTQLEDMGTGYLAPFLSRQKYDFQHGLSAHTHTWAASRVNYVLGNPTEEQSCSAPFLSGLAIKTISKVFVYHQNNRCRLPQAWIRSST